MHNDLARQILTASDIMRKTPGDGIFLIDSGMSVFTLRMDRDPIGLAAMEALQYAIKDSLFKSMLPLMIAKEKDVIKVRLSGIELQDPDSAAVTDLLADILEIETIQAAFTTEPGSFVFGAQGKTRPDNCLATIWADSPEEAVIKFQTMRHPGFSKHPDAVLARDIHGRGKIEMRSASDWSLHDIDDLLSRARSAVSSLKDPGARPF